MQSVNRSRHDVVVVGGRVAGSAAAMLLARLGRDVVVVDQASFPERHRVHTDRPQRRPPTPPLGAARRSPRQWGSGHPVVTFNAAGVVDHRTDQGHGRGRLRSRLAGMRWTRLATAAEQAGAEVHTGITVTGLQRDGHGRVVGVTGHDRAGGRIQISAGYVIGADGLGSRVAGLVDAPLNQVGPAAARPSTPTTAASRGAASSSSSPSGPSPARSRPTTGRRASSLHARCRTPRRSAAGPAHEWRPSASRWSVWPPSSPSGCARLADHRSRACSASLQPAAPGVRAGLGPGRGRRLLP